jgi:hypothetical protein
VRACAMQVGLARSRRARVREGRRGGGVARRLEAGRCLGAGEGERRREEKGGGKRKRGERNGKRKGEKEMEKEKGRKGGEEKKMGKKKRKKMTRAGEIRGGDHGWSATRARRSHAARGGRGVGPRPDSVSARGFRELGLRRKCFWKRFFFYFLACDFLGEFSGGHRSVTIDGIVLMKVNLNLACLV